MAVTPNHIIITNPDGSTTTVDITFTWTAPPVTPPPPPAGPVFPEGANAVTIGGISYPLSAIDPPTTDPTQPGGRGKDALIIITNPDTAARNQWGWEVSVDVNGGVRGFGLHRSVSAGEYVLSGNGKAAEFLKTVKTVGVTVQVTKRIVIPPPVDVPPATGHPVMGEYLMSGQWNMSQLYPKCNRAIVAFLQGTDLVSWKGETWTEPLTAWRAVGNRDILVSLGGQGGNVVLDQVDEAVARINATHFPVDGIDFDNEAFGLSTAQTIDICDATSGRLGKAPKDFIVQFVPPGGREDTAIATAKAVQAKGYRVYLGQQLYETSITDKQVMDQTAKVVDSLGAPSALVGIMIGDSHNSWTLSNVGPRLQMVKGKWKDIGGAYIWASDRAGTAEVVSTVGGVLGL